MTTANAMGIIFSNMHDSNLPEVVAHRTMASVPFAGRYRMIDFCLSGMANAGIHNIGVVVRQNYQSLMDHLGNGREWDLTRKRGGLIIFPPHGRDTGGLYQGRIEALNQIMPYIESNKEEYVVMSDCDTACNLDYADLLRSHRQSEADVTVVYERSPIPEGMRDDNSVLRLNDEGRVTEIRVNDYREGGQNLSMNVFVLRRKLLIDIVNDAVVRGLSLFEREVLSRSLKTRVVCGYHFTGYRARICDMHSYFEESLRLLKHENVEKLFPENRPIYTKVRDEAPVRYAIGARVQNSLVADGCIIEGEVENCVLFRGVHVGKGARVVGCVLMQGTEIAPDVEMENVVTDKNVTVCQGQMLRGAPSFPMFVAKGTRVL